MIDYLKRFLGLVFLGLVGCCVAGTVMWSLIWVMETASRQHGMPGAFAAMIAWLIVVFAAIGAYLGSK